MYTIFSIDGVNDLHAKAKFLRHMDTARAMDKLRGNMVLCIGAWEGVLEQSFMMLTADYKAHVEPYGFTDKQESVLEVPQDQRQPCVIVWNDGTREAIGPMRQVSPVEALQHKGWTYVPDRNAYYVAGSAE